MSREITFSLPIVELKSRSGHTLVTPVGFASAVQLGLSAQEAAEHFQQAAQRQLLQEGEYLEFMQLLQPRHYRLDTFKVEITADPKGDRFSPRWIELDFVQWSTPTSVLGMVPVLGVGAAAPALDGLIRQLRESVRLHLLETGRARSVRDLIALQWYEPPEIKPIEIDAVFHTPNELDALHQGETESLLPKTARRMMTPELPAFGIEHQVEELRRSLQGELRQSVMVLGPPGSGKSALIGEYIRTSRLPDEVRPWRTSAARMLQVLTESGGWQYQLGIWCREVRDTGAVVNMGPIAEFFEVGQYSGNDVSIAETLRDPIQRGEVTLICEATLDQLERMERKSPGYGDLFIRVDLGDRKPEEQDRIILQAAERLAEHHRVELAKDAVRKLVSLQRRYSPYSGFPGKTIRFLESLLILVQDDAMVSPPRQHGSQGRRRRLEEQDIIAAYCQESGLPAFLVDDRMRLDTAALIRFFDDAIIGQSKAKQAVHERLLAVKAGLHRGGRPIAGFLFVGPTGTGKTQLSKTLARYLFGSSDRMLRFDMSEYSDPWSVSRLTQTGEASLVTRVRQTPFAVLLFDEIEKADPSFNDLLLQILGEGRLTDDRGEVANFCSTIIIMTSNLGASDYMRPAMTFAGKTDDEDEVISHFEDSVKRHFRPELYNRIDQVVPFSALGPGERAEIIRLELESLVRNLPLSGRRHTLDYDDRLCTLLATLPLDTRYGARAIQRLLDREVIQPLSAELARMRDDPHHIRIGIDDAAVAFEIQPSDQGKRAGTALEQFSDDLSACRRSLQRVEESGRWLGLLSRFDRIESDKRRNEQQFWNHPSQTSMYQTLGAFVERQRTMVQQSLLLEEQGIDRLLAGSDPSREQASQQALTDLLHERQRHFTALLAYLEPEHNRALLLIHGMEPYLSLWAEQYHRFLDALGGEPKAVYLYRSRERENPPLAGLICNIEHRDPEECYQLHAKAQARRGRPDALGFLVKRPCIGYFLDKEPGIVSHVVEGRKDAKLSIELFADELDAYHPPEAVYRKRFYDNKKSLRRIREPHILEILDSQGAVVNTITWEHYLQQRKEQGEAAIVAALSPEPRP